MGRGKELLKKAEGFLRREPDPLPDNARYITLNEITPPQLLSFFERAFDNKELSKGQQKIVGELKKELRKEIAAAT